jgi:hypothetical protein
MVAALAPMHRGCVAFVEALIRGNAGFGGVSVDPRS